VIRGAPDQEHPFEQRHAVQVDQLVRLATALGVSYDTVKV